MSRLTAPFPYFGGKGAVPRVVWEHLGDVTHYIEPFCGSTAVLLARPPEHRNYGRNEMINDKAHFVANFWRACAAEPEMLAREMDWPVNETDLHSRQQWLVTRGAAIVKECEADPLFYDLQVAAWWAWGASCWIGSNWATDGRHAKPNMTPRGVNRLGLNDWSFAEHLPVNEALRQYILTLATRLRRTRVLAGDWSRCVKPSEVSEPKVGIFLDPPYDNTRREKGLYYHDDHITDAVVDWCRIHEDLRIVLAGLEGEYDLDWQVVVWRGRRSFASSKYTDNIDGRFRERLWISPGALGADGGW